MKDYKINGWKDYWKIFDELIEQLSSDKKSETVSEFNEAKKYVNGLTDGWHKFKFAFEKALDANREIMTQDQIQIADFLIRTLEESLTNR